MLLVAPIEAEHPHGPLDGPAPPARSDPGGRSTKDSAVGRGDAGDPGDPRPQLIERQLAAARWPGWARRSPGSRSCPASASARDDAATARLARGGVRQRDRRPGWHRADVEARCCASPCASGLCPPRREAARRSASSCRGTYVRGGGGSSLTTTSLAGAAPWFVDRERRRSPSAPARSGSARRQALLEAEPTAQR